MSCCWYFWHIVFSLKIPKTFTPSSLLPTDVDNILRSLPWIELPLHEFPSPRPPLDPSWASLHLNIIDVLKLIKSRRRSKSDLAIIDFDSINVHDVKYWIYYYYYYYDNVLFVLTILSMGVPSTYGHFVDEMDKIYDGHLWCTTRSTNIQKIIGFFSNIFLIMFIFISYKLYYIYMYSNGGVLKNIEWIGSIFVSFFARNVAPKKSRLKCKICCWTPVCISLCYVRLMSTSHPMRFQGLVYILVFMNTHVSSGTWCNSLDMGYQCVVNEVKNYAIVIATNKQFLANYILKIPSNSAGYHLACPFLEVVMDKFSNLASPKLS